MDDLRNAKNQTMLIQLVRNEKLGIIDQFIQTFHFQLDPNIADEDGRTALHFAVMKQSVIMVQKLKSYFGEKIKIDIVDKYGKMPVDYAEDEQKQKLKRAVHDIEDSESSLFNE